MNDDINAFDPKIFDGKLMGALAKNWWLFLLRGVLAIIFSIMAMIWPGLTLLALTLIWGSYALIDGAVALWAGLSGHAATRADRWWLAIMGVLGIVAGIITFWMPGYTAEILLMLIAVWAIILGVFQLLGAIRLRKEIEGEWLLALGGVLLLLYGILFIAQPAVGALSVIWMISLGSFLFGVLTIMFAMKLRSLTK